MGKSKIVAAEPPFTVGAIRRHEREVHKAYHRLAARVRAASVVPLCREFDLEFISGNGTWFFLTRADLYISARWQRTGESEVAALRLPARLWRCVDVLNEPLGRWTLGEFIEDYRRPEAAT